MKPDPFRYYVATTSYSSPASQAHLPRPGVVTAGMTLRGDHPVVVARPEVWIDAADDPETAARAFILAERMRQPTGPVTEPAEAEAADAVTQPRERRAGAPPGRRLHSEAAIVARFRELRDAAHGRRPSQQELAANLDPVIALRTLQGYLRDYDLPWPLE